MRSSTSSETVQDEADSGPFFDDFVTPQKLAKKQTSSETPETELPLLSRFRLALDLTGGAPGLSDLEDDDNDSETVFNLKRNMSIRQLHSGSDLASSSSKGGNETFQVNLDDEFKAVFNSVSQALETPVSTLSSPPRELYFAETTTIQTSQNISEALPFSSYVPTTTHAPLHSLLDTIDLDQLLNSVQDDPEKYTLTIRHMALERSSSSMLDKFGRPLVPFQEYERRVQTSIVENAPGNAIPTKTINLVGDAGETRKKIPSRFFYGNEKQVRSDRNDDSSFESAFIQNESTKTENDYWMLERRKIKQMLISKENPRDVITINDPELASKTIFANDAPLSSKNESTPKKKLSETWSIMNPIHSFIKQQIIRPLDVFRSYFEAQKEKRDFGAQTAAKTFHSVGTRAQNEEVIIHVPLDQIPDQPDIGYKPKPPKAKKMPKIKQKRIKQARVGLAFENGKPIETVSSVSNISVDETKYEEDSSECVKIQVNDSKPAPREPVVIKSPNLQSKLMDLKCLEMNAADITMECLTPTQKFVVSYGITVSEHSADQLIHFFVNFNEPRFAEPLSIFWDHRNQSVQCRVGVSDKKQGEKFLSLFGIKASSAVILQSEEDVFYPRIQAHKSYYALVVHESCSPQEKLKRFSKLLSHSTFQFGFRAGLTFKGVPGSTCVFIFQTVSTYMPSLKSDFIWLGPLESLPLIIPRIIENDFQAEESSIALEVAEETIAETLAVFQNYGFVAEQVNMKPHGWLSVTFRRASFDFYFRLLLSQWPSLVKTPCPKIASSSCRPLALQPSDYLFAFAMPYHLLIVFLSYYFHSDSKTARSSLIAINTIPSLSFEEASKMTNHAKTTSKWMCDIANFVGHKFAVVFVSGPDNTSFKAFYETRIAKEKEALNIGRDVFICPFDLWHGYFPEFSFSMPTRSCILLEHTDKTMSLLTQLLERFERMSFIVSGLKMVHLSFSARKNLASILNRPLNLKQLCYIGIMVERSHALKMAYETVKTFGSPSCLVSEDEQVVEKMAEIAFPFGPAFDMDVFNCNEYHLIARTPESWDERSLDGSIHRPFFPSRAKSKKDSAFPGWLLFVVQPVTKLSRPYLETLALFNRVLKTCDALSFGLTAIRYVSTSISQPTDVSLDLVPCLALVVTVPDHFTPVSAVLAFRKSSILQPGDLDVCLMPDTTSTGWQKMINDAAFWFGR